MKAILCFGGRVLHPCWALAIADKAAADIVRVQLIRGNGTDAPHLALGAAGGDVDPLPVQSLVIAPTRRPSPVATTSGKEHDVPFVALEVVRVAAAEFRRRSISFWPEQADEFSVR